MACDQRALERDLERARSRAVRNQPNDRLLARIEQQLQRSCAAVQRRRSLVPAISYPDDLPVTAARERLLEALARHQVVIVAGDTGSGKTTQLPKLCLELGRGDRGLIGHTQPRRIAARTVAARIAAELGVELGGVVGYQVRFADNSSDDTLVKLMTDGILLAEIQRDPLLQRYDTLIIDEAHERSLNIDFLLGYFKRLLVERSDLKLIITSATIDVQAFARHFDDAEVVEVCGRSYPVEVHYCPADVLSGDGDNELDLADQVVAAMHYIERLDRTGDGGDVLVFLPGEREIRNAAHRLRDACLRHTEIFPLYARLSVADQNRVFDLTGRRGRRVVLATNVAETSLTVPGIRYVIDSGLARISRYSARSKVQRLPVEPISRASADQRKGRCGRVGPGICIRLYSEADFEARTAYTDPEIRRTNLASVILQMKRMGLGEVAQFPFIDPPDDRYVRDGYRLLEELHAIDSGNLTETGAQLAALPVDPRVGRMLLAAGELGCLDEVLVIAAALSIQDPRERPADRQQAADRSHGRFADESSDFLGWVKLWRYFEQLRQALGSGRLKSTLKSEFLNVARLFEWRDLHRQLLLACRDLGLAVHREPASAETVHRALLTGLLSHIGQRGERREYLGTRGRKFLLFPGSQLAAKPPKWVMAAELVETSRLYARTVAAIDPRWVVELAAHLVKRQYSEPHYSTRRGDVLVYERVSLYGLVVSDRQRVSYGRIDPVVAREVFIRAALVEGHYAGRAAFWEHNRAVLAEVAGLEAKARRHDIRIDDEALFRFYDERVGDGVCNAKAFEKWRRRAEQQNARLLYLSREQVVQRDVGTLGEAQFPDRWRQQELELPLSYRFEPGGVTDGVSITVPAALLNRLDQMRLDWLVPGLLRDKVVALVKTLPREWRRQLVPVPDRVDRILLQLVPGEQRLTEALGEAFAREPGVTVPGSAWRPERLDDFYRMNIRVVDEQGQLLGQGRELAQLQRRFRRESEAQLAKSAGVVGQEHFRDWSFGPLPIERRMAHGDVEARAWPALVDRGDGVEVRMLDSAEAARRASVDGLLRLLRLRLASQVSYLRRELLRDNRQQLELSVLAERESFVEELIDAALIDVFVDAERPRTAEEFDALVERGRQLLVERFNAISAMVEEIVACHYEVRRSLGDLDRRVWAYVAEDVERQLAGLLFERFLRDAGRTRLAEYPRYLRAIAFRLARLGGHEQKDRAATAEITPLVQQLLERVDGDWLRASTQSPWADFRWLLEEFRVSLFAQPLGTRVPVSGKRLARAWQDALAIADQAG